jgi:hypothetical protein
MSVASITGDGIILSLKMPIEDIKVAFDIFCNYVVARYQKSPASKLINKTYDFRTILRRKQFRNFS